MFRFLALIILLTISFYAGRLSASQQELNASLFEISSLAQNESLKKDYPELYTQFMTFLATPEIIDSLTTRNQSEVYDKFIALVKELQKLV